MYIISIETHFDAAHHLVAYPGECGQLHGHRWRIVTQVKTEKINEIGICIDFKDLRSLVNSVIERFDHQHINKIPPFDTLNPTAENLSKYIFEEVEKTLPDNIFMKDVTVWESDKQSVTWHKS